MADSDDINFNTKTITSLVDALKQDEINLKEVWKPYPYTSNNSLGMKTKYIKYSEFSYMLNNINNIFISVENALVTASESFTAADEEVSKEVSK